MYGHEVMMSLQKRHRLMMSFGLRVPPNVMICVEFGFDRSRGFGSARGQFWPIAIDRPTRP
jgi:hypothetical protein